MKIIISPAKKMRRETDFFLAEDMPMFDGRAEELIKILKTKSRSELKKLYSCSEKILDESIYALEHYGEGIRVPCVMSFDGIAYKYMSPEVMTYDEIAYIKENLFILSALYGVLRPFDGVYPYRLEMNSPLKTESFKSLYDYWKDEIAKTVFAYGEPVINLASEEYSRCLKRYKTQSNTFIDVIFYDRCDGGELKEKGVYCKMSRGAMTRFAAENKITEPEKLKSFSRFGYSFCEEMSDDETYIFIKEKSKGK